MQDKDSSNLTERGAQTHVNHGGKRAISSIPNSDNKRNKLEMRKHEMYCLDTPTETGY